MSRPAIGALGAVIALSASTASASIIHATTVENFDQGLRKDGNPVDANRSDPTEALGAPEGTDTLNFVALGFGGSITLSFGEDFTGPAIVVETTYNLTPDSNYIERAEVFVGTGASWNSATYYSLGTILNTEDANTISLLPAYQASGGTSFQYMRIVDMTDPSIHNGSADGYDVDGVTVQQIPAPGAVAMAALGLGAMARRRRA